MACPMRRTEGSDDAKDDGKGLTYGVYLKVPELLSLQELQSEKQAGEAAHDELLFITIHQVYELWFKQILFELDSVRSAFLSTYLREARMLEIVSRLHRIVEILKVCVSQTVVLETMTPLDFMDFRDYLGSSSGFQSTQFRLLENKLGVRPERRVQLGKEHYSSPLSDVDRESVLTAEEEPSLFILVEKWLERTPGLEEEGFNFKEKYAAAVENMYKDDVTAAQQSDDGGNALKSCAKNKEIFESMLLKEEHDKHIRRGDRRLSHKATLGALMIFLYREVPIFSLPFKMLQLCQDIDTLLMKWRHNHVMMVQRIIGSKVGSGGSSGYHYLRSTVSDRYKVFLDLFNLATFFVPRAYVPKIDEATEEVLHAKFNAKSDIAKVLKTEQ